MEYVVKETKSSAPRYIDVESNGWVNFRFNIGEAKPHKTIADAVETVQHYTHRNGDGVLFTIVGRKDVTTPTYEEVEL